MQIERYHLRTGPHGLVIEMRQTKRAFVVLIVSLVLFGLAWYAASTTGDPSARLGVGLFFGFFVIAAIAGMLFSESFMFGTSELSYKHSFRRGLRTFSRDEIVRIELDVQRRSAASRGPGILPWSVRVVGRYDKVADFKFEREKSARELAQEIARHWDLEVVDLTP